MMEKEHLENIIKNKYSHLLIALVVLFLVAPFFDRLDLKFPISHFLFFAIILATLRVIKIKRSIFITIVVVTLLGLSLEYLAYLDLMPFSEKVMSIIILMAYAISMGFALTLFIKSIFSEKFVSSDTIKGGISIYLLIGSWWTIAQC